VSVNPAQQTPQQNIPASFEEALKADWEFYDEKIVVSINRKEKTQRRYGVVLLRTEGRTYKLAVPYSATVNGYSFRAPRIL
jgi:hypothetical protein